MAVALQDREGRRVLERLLGDPFKALSGRWSTVAFSFAFAASAERACEPADQPPADDTRNRFFYAWVPFSTPLAEFAADLAAVDGVDAQSLSSDPPVTIPCTAVTSGTTTQ